MSAYESHKKLIRRYVDHVKSKTLSSIETSETDIDIIRKNHKFIRDEKADATSDSWEIRMALKYYQRLCKEYAICDLSKHKTGAVGLRWRTEREVLSGKGQWECSARGCEERKDLHSYEVNFAYTEQNFARNELVKVRLCPKCAQKLYYRKLKELAKQSKSEYIDKSGHELVHCALDSKSSGDEIKRQRKKRKLDSNEQIDCKIVNEHEEVSIKNCIIEADASELWSMPIKKEHTAEDDMDDFLKDLFV